MTIDNRTITTILALALMFTGVTIVPMLFYQQGQLLIEQNVKLEKILYQLGNMSRPEREELLEKFEDSLKLGPEIKNDIRNLNNKINELFFERNATDLPTHVFVPNLTKPQ